MLSDRVVLCEDAALVSYFAVIVSYFAYEPLAKLHKFAEFTHLRFKV
jgi:hypothetical protein